MEIYNLCGIVCEIENYFFKFYFRKTFYCLAQKNQTNFMSSKAWGCHVIRIRNECFESNPIFLNFFENFSLYHKKKVSSLLCFLLLALLFVPRASSNDYFFSLAVLG